MSTAQNSISRKIRLAMTDSFHRGVLAALALVALYDEETLFREIVRINREKDLVEVARADGQMKMSGLSKYGYGRKSKKAKAKK